MKQILISIILLGCASQSHKQTSYEVAEESNEDVPVWVYAPLETCDHKKNLCASAEGDSFDGADTKAIEAIASIFSTSVNSKKSLQRSGSTEILMEASKEGTGEKFVSQIEKKTQALLKGVTIAQRFKKGKSFYSLALLSKKIASKSLKHQLEVLDTRLIELHDKSAKTSILKLKSLLFERNELASGLTVLGIPFRRTPVSLSEINEIAKSSEAKVFISSKGVAPVLVNQLKSVLVASSIEIVEQSKLSTSIVDAQMSVDEVYLNVKGFKKYKTKLTIKTVRGGKTVGLMGVTVSATGRSKEDAIQKSQYLAKKQIQQKIEQLNIR